MSGAFTEVANATTICANFLADEGVIVENSSLAFFVFSRGFVEDERLINSDLVVTSFIEAGDDFGPFVEGNLPLQNVERR